MNTIADLIDRARARSGIPTDTAMGARIGKSKQTMSQWRSGIRKPEDDDVIKLCRIAGVEPAEWLLVAQIARSSGPAHDAWLALARRLSTAAAIGLIASVLALPAPAKALVTRHEARNPKMNEAQKYTLCEVRDVCVPWRGLLAAG